MNDKYFSRYFFEHAHIEVGREKKVEQGSLYIEFQTEFRDEPFVIVSSYWAGEGRGVDHVDTVTDITTTGFTVTSDNANERHYVDWIAVSPTG